MRKEKIWTLSLTFPILTMTFWKILIFLQGKLELIVKLTVVVAIQFVFLISVSAVQDGACSGRQTAGETDQSTDATHGFQGKMMT